MLFLEKKIVSIYFVWVVFTDLSTFYILYITTGVFYENLLFCIVCYKYMHYSVLLFNYCFIL